MRTHHAQISKTSALALAAGLASAVLAPVTSAQTLSWSNALGGSASTAGNWSPAAIPGAANDLLWNLNNAYTVTFNSSTTASRTHVYRRGTVTLVASSPHTVSNGITIGDTNALTGTMTLTTGTVNSTGSVVIGSAAGSGGILNVDDDDADLIINGAGADLTVASNSPGTLNITNGGLVQVADQFIAGNNTAGTSTVTVSGATNTPPLARSTLIVQGTGATSRLGQGGDATVNISGGALADFSGSVVVANGTSSTSTVTVAGTGGLVPQRATLDVAGDLLVGNNANVNPAGAGTLTVGGGGDVLVGGTLHVGDDPDGGTGILNINASSLVQAASVIDGAAGTINHTGGTLRINGGTYTGAAAPLVVSGLTANDVTLAFANNAAQTLVPAGGVSLIVGDDLGAGTFEGFLRIESGADLNVGNGDVNLGDDAGTTGRVTITGAGSRLIADSVNSDVRVGFSGTGNVFIESGGQLLCKNLLVPALTNAEGFVDCGDHNSNITTQFLSVGQSGGTGQGQLQVQLGATLNVTSPGFSTNIRSTGKLIVASDGIMTTPGTVTVDAGGELRVGSIVTGAALVDVFGNLNSTTRTGITSLVDAPVHLRAGGVLDATNETFTVGDAASISGFVSDLGSTIRTGTRTLTLLDLDDAVVASAEMAGGTLSAPHGITIPNNGTIDGTGTITTPQLFFSSGAGVITATGADGITINGLLRNLAGTIDGTKFTFAGPDGGWTGAGTINAKAVFNTGTTINALANMTIGDGSAFGATFNGVIHLNDSDLTIVDSNGCGLGTLTDMNGGDLQSSNGLVVNSGRVLRGHGRLFAGGAGFTNFGTIEPAARTSASSPYERFGQFIVAGAYTQGATSHYRCDIAGTTDELRGTFDRITVVGVATLGGTLDVSVIDGRVPREGDVFIILSASSVVGTFDTENLPANMIVVYESNLVRLMVIPCPADFNQDGGIDGTDVEAFFAAWEGGDASADVNLDGGIDGTDVEAFFAAWESGGCG
ncbi:MAG: hypothetical protein JSR77_17075 [Planctomycetes bacterium]|nr:hypothetical protein [Planctomycetota bacterium]